MADNLATWVVELEVAGAAELDRALDGAKQKAQEQAKAIEAGQVVIAGKYPVSISRLKELQGIIDANKKSTKEFQGAFDAAGEAHKKRAQAMTEAHKRHATNVLLGQLALAGSYTYLTNKVMGYVSAGIAASVEGQRLAWVQEQLNRQIGSLFAPQIRAVIDGLTRLMERMHSLTGDQQAQIRNTILGTTAFFGMYSLAPLLAAGLGKIGLAMAAITGQPLLAAGAAIAALTLGTDEGRQALASLIRAAQPLADALAKVVEAMTPLTSVFRAFAGIIESVAPAIQALARVVEIVGPTAALAATYYLLGQAILWTSAQVGTMTGALFLKAKAAFTAATGVGALRTAVAGLGLALKTLGPLLLPMIVGAIALEAISRLFAPKERGREDLGMRQGAVESFDAAFLRVQQAAAGRDVAQTTRERSLRELERIRAAAERSAGAPGPAVVGA